MSEKHEWARDYNKDHHGWDPLYYECKKCKSLPERQAGAVLKGENLMSENQQGPELTLLDKIGLWVKICERLERKPDGHKMYPGDWNDLRAILTKSAALIASLGPKP